MPLLDHFNPPLNRTHPWRSFHGAWAAAMARLLSPRNKDRPAARQAIAVKCVGYLQQGSSVVVVDTVTTRRADLNSTILCLLGVDVGAIALPLASLSAVSYRAVGREEESQQLE